MDVTIETMPELTVFAVRHLGPYNQISNAFAELGKRAAAAGLLGFPGVTMLAVYHDDAEETPADQLRSDAGLSVPKGTPPVEGLSVFTLPAGTYARTTHLGSYDRLGDTWAHLMGGWLPRSGHRVAGTPSFEIYRNHPGNAKTEELRTDLYVPLE